MFLTLIITHIITFKLNTYFKHLPLDFLSICGYCMFLDIYILGSVAT